MIPAPARRLAGRLSGRLAARRPTRRGARPAGGRAPAAEVLEDRALLSNITVNVAAFGGEYVVADGVECVTFTGTVNPNEADFTINAENVANELELIWRAGFGAPADEEYSLTVSGNEEGAGLSFEADGTIVVTEFSFTGTAGDDALIGRIFCTQRIFDDEGALESDGGDLEVEFFGGDNTTDRADLRTGAGFDDEEGHTLSITALEGDDTLGPILTNGNVELDLGDGVNRTRIVATRGVGVTDDGVFGRDVTVTTGAEGSRTTVGNVNATGAVLYNGGAGDDVLGNVESDTINLSENVVVNLGEGTNVAGDISSDDGFVQVTGGSGSDTIGDVDVDGEFSFLVIGSAEARVNLGDGTNATGTLTSRRGTVRYVGGSGDDTIAAVITTSDGVAPDNFVPDEPGERQRPDFGDAVIQLGDGNNAVGLRGGVTANFGDVSITAGDGNDSLGLVYAGAGLTAPTGRGTVLVGSGDIAKPTADVTEFRFRLIGDVYLALGDGDNDTAEIISGESTIYYVGGSGADTIGDVTSTADFDVDRDALSPGGLNEIYLELGDGDDRVGDITMTDGGDVLLLGGGGDEVVGDVFADGVQQNTSVARFDVITLDYGSGSSATGAVVATNGSITIRGGNGDDFLDSAVALDELDQAVPGTTDLARITVDFGRGDNAVLGVLDGSDGVTYLGGRDVDSLGDVISRQGEANLQLGAGEDFLGDVTAQTIFVDLGEGDDTAGDFEALRTGRDNVRGFDTLTLEAGEGDDAFGDLVSAENVVLEAQGGDDFVTFVQAGRNANLDLGDGDDLIDGNVTARFDINVEMGDGDDGIGGTLDAGDSAFVNLGEDDDSFTGVIRAGTINAGGSILLDGDDGDDVLNGVLDATGAIEVDAGSGDDFLGGTLSADDDVEIDLGRGNDAANVRSIDSTNGALVIDAGNGRDRVTLRNVAVAEGEDIELGLGNNFLILGEGVIDGRSVIHADGSLTVTGLDAPGFAGRTYLDDRRVRAEGNLQVVTDKAEMEGGYTIVGRGDTNIRVDAQIEGDVIVIGSGTAAVDFSGSEVGGDTSVRTSSRNDKIDFFGATLAGDLVIVTIAGTDTANVRNTTVGGDLIVNLGVSDDRLVIADATVAGRTAVNMERGSDYVAVIDSDLRGDASFLLGEGNDTLSVAGADVGGGLIVNAGAGRDGARVRNLSVTDDLYISMGGDNDFLNADRLAAGGDVNVIGGGGRDRLDVDAAIDGRVRSFERRG